ncbi:MAG: hypothetical protein KA735_05585 [Burkholderiaceae bacterium]|nr:hypothetical protein [Burkholderiaceae bacterium]
MADQPSRALQVTPYLWAAGLDGHISPFRRGPTIGIDKSFSDVLSDLKVGGFINIWGRYDRYVLSGDVVYVNTKESQAIGPLPPIGPRPSGTAVNGSVDTKQFVATLLGGYRLLETPDFTLDTLGGVRFWHISNKVKVSALGLSRNYNESFGWVEPVIGARTFMRLTNKFSLQVQADIGGFGTGSDLAWSALATINYTFTDKLSVSAGYKVLDVDYDHNGHVYDTRLSGPVLGLTYRF